MHQTVRDINSQEKKNLHFTFCIFTYMLYCAVHAQEFNKCLIQIIWHLCSQSLLPFQRHLITFMVQWRPNSRAERVRVVFIHPFSPHFTGCTVQSKLLNLFEPKFPHLVIITFRGLLQGHNNSGHLLSHCWNCLYVFTNAVFSTIQ